MSEITYQVHWLSFTVHCENEEAMALYDNIFKDTFGNLEELGNGGRGFKEIYHSLLAFKLYMTPAHSDTKYVHFEIPGQACEMIDWQHWQALAIYLEANFQEKYKATRFDFAFDHLGFTPEQVEEAIRANALRSLAKRDSLKIHASPFQKRESGDEIGTYTVEFGSNKSERMITVYNKRGYTRLEFQMKDRRAHLVTWQVLLADPDRRIPLVISHLLDFIEFQTDWWGAFIHSEKRANKVVSSPREISLNKTISWMDKQVSAALSVVYDAASPAMVDLLIRRGRKKRGARYSGLVQDQLGEGVRSQAEGGTKR